MYPWGVRVSILEPGEFQTDMHQPSKLGKCFKDGWENLVDQLKEEYGEQYLNGGNSSANRESEFCLIKRCHYYSLNCNYV